MISEEDIRRRILENVERHSSHPPKYILATDRLINLCTDSLDMVEVVLEVESAYGIKPETGDYRVPETVGDLIHHVQRNFQTLA
jgi:acyl carrier protein